MATEASVRSGIARLKRTNPNIHINYHNAHPKMHITNAPAVIRNVYAHLFELEYAQEGHNSVKIHSYADVISKRIEIIELMDE